MNWRKNLRLSAQALGRSPWRTLLSSAGMSVGIASMVLLLGVGAGAERAFRQTLETMGKNLLAISPARTEGDALRGDARPVETLIMDDWRAVNRLDDVERSAPVAMGEHALRYGKRTLQATVIGTTPGFRHTNRQTLAAGRFLDTHDVESHSRVAVIGARIQRELFFGEWPLGERVQVAGVPFTVIGVLREKGVDPTGADEDNRILIPILTGQRRLWNKDYLDRLFVQAVSKPALDRLDSDLKALLRDRHGLARKIQRPSAAAPYPPASPASEANSAPQHTASMPASQTMSSSLYLQASPAPRGEVDEFSGLEEREDDFTLQTQAALIAALDEVDQTFSNLLAGLAALTLGLAGLGLLAVSLLSVRERHGEIGLRLAVGARPRHVLVQFMAEAVMIAGLGALGGLLVGGVGIILGERLVGWPLALSWKAVALPFLVSLGLSLAFGAYPALRAARLDPIVALRSQ